MIICASLVRHPSVQPTRGARSPANRTIARTSAVRARIRATFRASPSDVRDNTGDSGPVSIRRTGSGPSKRRDRANSCVSSTRDREMCWLRALHPKIANAFGGTAGCPDFRPRAAVMYGEPLGLHAAGHGAQSTKR